MSPFLLMRKSKYFRRHSSSVTLTLFFLTITLAQGTHSAELRPYELPSQKNAPYRQESPQNYQAPVQKSLEQNFDYALFAERAENLSPEERNKLREGLQQRLDRAIEMKNYVEVRHYAKLLEIINRPK